MVENIRAIDDGVGLADPTFLEENYVDMHLHTKFSLKDGMIRTLNHDDPKHVKEDIIQIAENRGHGIVTATDHGNMYGQAQIAMAAKNFGMKHIVGCEFYVAANPLDVAGTDALIGDARHIKTGFARRGESYYHLCAWAKNAEGYANLCRLQYYSSQKDAFYYENRIDLSLIDAYGDGIIWGSACLGGPIDKNIMRGHEETARLYFDWFIERFGDDFVLEYQSHGIEAEDLVNKVKMDWATKSGTMIIATTDAHFHKKEQIDHHKMLLSIQYSQKFGTPGLGFPGSGYHILSKQELINSYPVEYLKNTKTLADRCEGGLIKFGDIVVPKFEVPTWFTRDNELMVKG